MSITRWLPQWVHDRRAAVESEARRLAPFHTSSIQAATIAAGDVEMRRYVDGEAVGDAYSLLRSVDLSRWSTDPETRAAILAARDAVKRVRNRMFDRQWQVHEDYQAQRPNGGA